MRKMLRPFALLAAAVLLCGVVYAQSKPEVQLTSFTLKTGNGEVVLEWTVAETGATCVFDVERSADDVTYTRMASLAKSGNTTQYRFRDGAPVKGVAFYRLRLKAPDGAVAYSGTLMTERPAAGAEWSIRSVSSAALDITGLDRRQYSVELISLSGGAVYRQSVGGVDRHTIDISAIPSGAYILRIGGRSVTFLKQ